MWPDPRSRIVCLEECYKKLKKMILCSSTKYPYSTQGGSLEIPRGGVPRKNYFTGKNEAKLKFPVGWGLVQIFWNNTFSMLKFSYQESDTCSYLAVHCSSLPQEYEDPLDCIPSKPKATQV